MATNHPLHYEQTEARYYEAVRNLFVYVSERHHTNEKEIRRRAELDLRIQEAELEVRERSKRLNKGDKK